jgi:MFS family permease
MNIRRPLRQQHAKDVLDGPYSWRVIILTMVITSLSFGAITSVPILLKPIAAEWGSDIRSVSMVHMSSMLGAGFGSLLLGRLVDRFGFFSIAIAGAMATTAGLALAANANQLLTLHLAYGLLVGGLGQAAFFSPIAAESSRWFDRHRSFAIAMAASGQSLGGLTAPFLLRAWADDYGWRIALVIYGSGAGLIILLCALVFRRAAPGSAVLANTEPAKPLPGPIRRRVLLLCCALSLSGFSTFIVIGHLTSYGDEQGFSSTLSAALLSTLLGVALLSRLSIGALGARLGRSRMLFAASATQWLGTILLIAGHGLWSIVAGAALIGLGFGGYLPSYAVIMRDMFPDGQSGRRFSEIYFLVFMTAGLGSWMGGYLRDLTGSYTTSFGLASICTGLALLILGMSGMRRTQ